MTILIHLGITEELSSSSNSSYTSQAGSSNTFPSSIAGPSRHTPIPASTPPLQAPQWIQSSLNPEEDVRRLVAAMGGSKRIVVVCGAGISTAASIPDFRSSEGLFSSSLSHNPFTSLNSQSQSARSSSTSTPRDNNNTKRKDKSPKIRDLFHIKSLSSPTTLASHQSIINDLYELSSKALPTQFHKFLGQLDKEGRLLRCYTQNIDGLEEQAGLKTGIPMLPINKPKGRRKRSFVTSLGGGVGPGPAGKRRKMSGGSDGHLDVGNHAESTTIVQEFDWEGTDPNPAEELDSNRSTTLASTSESSMPLTPTPPATYPSSPLSLSPPDLLPCTTSSTTDSTAPTTPTPTPEPIPTPQQPSPLPPRCIPLHGQLSSLYCQVCTTQLPISPYIPLPPTLIPCPTCLTTFQTRHAKSKRARAVGALRANVVLYGEDHPLGECIGKQVERDLRGIGPKGFREGKIDFLVVVGSSLTIPGVKRMIKEFAKSLHVKTANNAEQQSIENSGLGKRGAATANYNKRGKMSSSSRPRRIKTVLINNEFPKGSEWKDVFDVWVKGDIQHFTTNYLENPTYTVELSTPQSTVPSPKKSSGQSRSTYRFTQTPRTPPPKRRETNNIMDNMSTPPDTTSSSNRSSPCGIQTPTPAPAPTAIQSISLGKKRKYEPYPTQASTPTRTSPRRTKFPASEDSIPSWMMINSRYTPSAYKSTVQSNDVRVVDVEDLYRRGFEGSLTPLSGEEDGGFWL